MEGNQILLPFFHLGVALVIGLLIGFERGWQKRDADSGQRVAGVRTFAIVGLAGGVSGLLTTELDAPVIFGMAAIALAIMLTAAHMVSVKASRGYGITSEVATFTTFLLAALAAIGQPTVAMAGAVVTVLLLGLKSELHNSLRILSHDEVVAILKLLVITVIVLPMLPNRMLGPWDAINPFELWTLVILVTAISFAGHFAIRFLGQSRGILVSGLLGGVASSTALTVSFAYLAKRRKQLSDLLATGAVLAQAVSIPRMLIVVWFVSQTLAQSMLASMTVLMLVTLIGGFILHVLTSTRISHKHAPRKLGPPFNLKEVISFGFLLVVTTLVAAAVNAYIGDYAIYPVAIIGAFVNLTAVALSIAQLYQSGAIAGDVAAQALVIAAATSGLFKAGIALWIGGFRLGSRIAAVAVVATAITMVVLFWPVWA